MAADHHRIITAVTRYEPKLIGWYAVGVLVGMGVDDFFHSLVNDLFHRLPYMANQRDSSIITQVEGISFLVDVCHYDVFPFRWYYARGEGLIDRMQTGGHTGWAFHQRLVYFDGDLIEVGNMVQKSK